MTEEKTIQTSAIDALKHHGIHRISVAIGVFDGVHAGHRKLLDELMKIADSTDSVPVAVTFSPHPRQVLQPESAPALLLPTEEKLNRLTECGVKAVVTIPFTTDFATKSPEAFIADCLESDGIELCGVCVGKKWRFGAHGAGDTDLLARIARDRGFVFVPVEEVVLDDETVSSSSIRKAAAAGDLEKATRFLCRPYAIYGTVVHGQGVAGKKLDAPTANLKIDYGVLPPAGVYAASVIFPDDGNSRHPAVVNIGSAPTFDSYGVRDLLRVEAHLLEGGFDLYEKQIVLEPVQFIRPEQKFESIDALKVQIVRDITETKNILQKKGSRQMTTGSGKYTVIELSDALGVKRTTVNDWLAKYSVYIEFTLQGKRRIYSDNTLAVLRKISELRGQGLSSFEIDSTLAKLYAVHPQPEPENMTETTVKTGETLPAPDPVTPPSVPQRIDYQSEQAEELLRQFRAMMEKIDRLEAAAAALPPPAEPVKKTGSTSWLVLVLLLLAGIGAGSYYGYRLLTDLRARNANQEMLLRQQQLKLSQQKTAMQLQMEEHTARLAEQEALRQAEARALKAQAEKEKAELIARFNEQRLIAERAVAERKALEETCAAQKGQIEAQQKLAAEREATIRKELDQLRIALENAKRNAAKDQTAAAEVQRLTAQIKVLQEAANKTRLDQQKLKEKAEAAEAARKKAEAEAAKAQAELKKLNEQRPAADTPAAPAAQQ